MLSNPIAQILEEENIDYSQLLKLIAAFSKSPKENRTLEKLYPRLRSMNIHKAHELGSKLIALLNAGDGKDAISESDIARIRQLFKLS